MNPQNCCGHPCAARSCSRPRDGVFGTLLKAIIAYVLVVAGSGTLMRAHHPVAVEAGRLLHVVSCVDPAIRFAETHDLGPIANGLRFIAGGIAI